MFTSMLKKLAVNTATHVHVNAEKRPVYKALHGHVNAEKRGSVTENNAPHVPVYTKNEGGWEGVS